MKDQKITAFGQAHTYLEPKMQNQNATEVPMVKKVSKLDEVKLGTSLRTDLILLGIGLFSMLIVIITGA